MAQVTPKGHRYDFNIVAEAFVGYSYKNYFQCGIALEKGPILQDFQFKAITEMSLKRKHKIFTNVPRHAVISACQCTIAGVNYLIITPREEEDTLIVFKLSI